MSVWENCMIWPLRTWICTITRMPSFIVTNYSPCQTTISDVCISWVNAILGTMISRRYIPSSREESYSPIISASSFWPLSLFTWTNSTNNVFLYWNSTSTIHSLTTKWKAAKASYEDSAIKPSKTRPLLWKLINKHSKKTTQTQRPSIVWLMVN